MRVETTQVERNEVPVTGAAIDKRRMRNEFWYLVHTADRRRKRANAIVVATTLVVIGLVALFYVLLTG